MQKVKPSILIVMKDAHLREVFLNRFEQEGFSVEAAADEGEAERKASKSRPSIIFIELENEEMAAERIKYWRSLPTLMKTKIALLFSRASRTHIHEALEAGADRVILAETLSIRDTVKSLTKLLSDTNRV